MLILSLVHLHTMLAHPIVIHGECLHGIMIGIGHLIRGMAHLGTHGMVHRGAGMDQDIGILGIIQVGDGVVILEAILGGEAIIHMAGMIPSVHRTPMVMVVDLSVMATLVHAHLIQIMVA